MKRLLAVFYLGLWDPKPPTTPTVQAPNRFLNDASELEGLFKSKGATAQYMGDTP